MTSRPPQPEALPDLSDSFQEFVRPLLERFPRRFRLTDLRDPLMVAASVWNQVIALEGDLVGAVADVAQMIEEFQFHPASASLLATLEALAARKASVFAGDDRLVVELEVHRRGADVRVLASTLPLSGLNAVLVPHYAACRGDPGPESRFVRVGRCAGEAQMWTLQPPETSPPSWFGCAASASSHSVTPSCPFASSKS